MIDATTTLRLAKRTDQATHLQEKHFAPVSAQCLNRRCFNGGTWRFQIENSSARKLPRSVPHHAPDLIFERSWPFTRRFIPGGVYLGKGQEAARPCASFQKACLPPLFAIRPGAPLSVSPGRCLRTYRVQTGPVRGGRDISSWLT